MIEEIQKSIQLINFNDSIFDQKSEVNKDDTFGVVVDDQKMLKCHGNHTVKHVNFNDLLMKIFDEQHEEIGKVLIAYLPLLKITNFSSLIERQRKIQAEIEEQCFGRAFCNEIVKGLLEYSDKLYKNENSFDIDFPVVLMKRIPNFMNQKRFDLQSIGTSFCLIEARLYAKLDFQDFYKNGTKFKFLDLFNKFTNYLINEILKASSREDRRFVVKRILKLANKFASIGAMNSLKCCMAALECNSIHRLHVIKDQGLKYQKRFKTLSTLTSPEGNFKELRNCKCLIPWLGIIMKDFTFIKETHKQLNEKFEVNVPLGHCLVKLLDSMLEARDVCENYVKSAKEEELKNAAIMEEWLLNFEIEFKDEDSQYEKSRQILF